MHIKLEYILLQSIIFLGEQWISGSSVNIIVTLNPNNQIYVNNGGALSLTCDVNQNTGFSSVFFKREINKVFITSIYNCSYKNADPDDLNTYNVTCAGQRKFTMVKYGITSDDHNRMWSCFLNSASASEGTCRGISNPCVSSNVTVIIRVPVTTVKLTDGSGKVLHSSVNIVRGESTGIICTTAPEGSRPRASFQWYYRQGNQSPIQIVDQSVSSTPDPGTVPGQPESDLLISYSTWTLTGSASYHNMYIYCQARDETNTGDYVQSDEIQINIVYHPSVHLSTYQSIYNVTVTEGMQNYVFNCNIIEANPLPQPNSYSWLHKAFIIPGQTSSSYTLSVVQRTDAGEYKCTARNDYGNGTSDPLDLNVQYAPDVKVNISGFAVVSSAAVLMCVPQGNPPQYTFHPWIHRVGQTEIRRLDGVNTVSLSTLSLSNISIQDMGTYICTVDNSITGLDGQINQLGDTHVYVQGYPVLDKTQTTFAGEPFKSASILIPFYSHTSILMPKFIKQLDSSVVSNTSDISIYIQPSNITMMFYMKKVMIPGHVAVLYFRNVTETDFGNYTLQLSNDNGTVSMQFDFIASVHPSMPKNFFFIHIEDGRLVFGIEKGFNGGHDQTFIVEYQPSGMPKATWSTIFRIKETDLDDPFTNGTYFIKIPKIQPGQYVFRVYAENEKGNSSAIEGVYAEIKAEPLPVGTDVQVGAVVGGVVGGILLVVVIVVVAVVMKRRTLQPKMKAFEREEDSTDRNHRKSQLVGNPVYEASNSRSGIAVVTHVEDSSTLYAQVNKTKTNKEKATAKGKHGKTSKAPSKEKPGKTSRGDIYENATQAVKGSAENEYENPGQLATGPSSGDNVYETPEESASKGKMVGLLYADVILGPPTKKAGKPIIHGEEERTEYAEIAYGKRGEPLPETDEGKETGGAKKNGTK